MQCKCQLTLKLYELSFFLGVSFEGGKREEVMVLVKKVEVGYIFTLSCIQRPAGPPAGKNIAYAAGGLYYKPH
jgi:hypothetical protein